MARRTDNMQRSPGMTPIDHPAPYEPGKYDTDDVTGKLGVQEDEDNEEELKNPKSPEQKKKGKAATQR